MPKYCNFCGDTDHTQFYCKKKPRAVINQVGKRTKQNFKHKTKFMKLYPPDYRGYWYCYLRISPLCPRYLDKESLTVEHVIAKGKGEQYRDDPKNWKPACYPCNSLKGSRSIESLMIEYPHISIDIA